MFESILHFLDLKCKDNLQLVIVIIIIILDRKIKKRIYKELRSQDPKMGLQIPLEPSKD